VKRVSMILVCLLSLGVFLESADYSDQLFEIMQVVDEKKYAEAISGYEKFLKTAPQSLHGAVQFEIATLRAALGQKDPALSQMEQAVQSGFDDCLAAVQYDEWKPFRADARFTDLFQKAQISEADLQELHWLKSEIEHVNHDTKMMITENTNRMDTNFTVIPQSQIPNRSTTSSGVLFNREILKMMHEVQRSFVMQSDTARIEHVTSMAIISGGTSSEQILESSRLASHAAEERKGAIQGRRFLASASAGTAPRSCSDWNK
jgi:hypothetical protein